jgi:oligosaccharide repeat unit polymerase
MILRPLRERDGVLQFPLLAGVGALGFLFTQALGLVRNPEMVPEDGLSKTLIMCILCNLALFAGWYRAVPASWRRPAKWYHPPGKVYWVGIAFLAVGGVALFRLLALAGGLLKGFSTDTEITDWSGLPIIYLFFASLSGTGLVLVGMTALRSRETWWRLAPTAPFLLLQLATVVLGGRRSVFIGLILLALCVPYFTRQYLPPRATLLITAAAAVLAVFMFPATRKYTVIGGDRTKLENVSVADTGQSVLAGRTSEFWVATYAIEITSADNEYMWGARTYDNFVGLYVPKILVGGADAKARLFLDVPQPGANDANSYNWVWPTGMHATGPASVFMDFGYAGALLYWFLARVMRRLWVRATEDDDLRAQCLYTLLIAFAVGALTDDFSGSLLAALPIGVFAPVFGFWLIKAEVLAPVPGPSEEEAPLAAPTGV